MAIFQRYIKLTASSSREKYFYAFHTADSTEDALMSLCAIKENVGHFLTPGDIKYNRLGWLAQAINLGDIMDTIRKTIKARTWKDGKEIHSEDQTLPGKSGICLAFYSR